MKASEGGELHYQEVSKALDLFEVDYIDEEGEKLTIKQEGALSA